MSILPLFARCRPPAAPAAHQGPPALVGTPRLRMACDQLRAEIVDGRPVVHAPWGYYERHGHSWVHAPEGDRARLVDVRWPELVRVLDDEADHLARLQASEGVLIRAFGGAA